MKKNVDVAVIGGGPAGLAAAISARQEGAARVIVFERNAGLGGILQQCIHTGFGTRILNADLTGPEYAERFIEEVEKNNIEVEVETMVLDVYPSRVECVNRQNGPFSVDAKSVVLAMGCRERPCGALRIPGTRPAGIFTAGTAQWYVNVFGYVPGNRVVILGSGDVGLIMARRLTLEGAKVEAVVEIMPYPGGLSRNVVQCLLDYEIPLLLRHTVTRIHGRDRVEGVSVAQVDEELNPISGTERFIPCDTLLLSVGLIPENELSRKAGILIDPATSGPIVDETFETSTPSIYACGNVVYVHDLVDYVTEEGYVAGKYAALRAMGATPRPRKRETVVRIGRNIRYLVPQRLRWEVERANLALRVNHPEERVRICLSSRRQLFLEVPRVWIRPSEIVRIPLSRTILEQLDGELNVSVEEG